MRGSVRFTEEWRPSGSSSGHSPRSRSAASPRLSKVTLTPARRAAGPQTEGVSSGRSLMYSPARTGVSGVGVRGARHGHGVAQASQVHDRFIQVMYQAIKQRCWTYLSPAVRMVRREMVEGGIA